MTKLGKILIIAEKPSVGRDIAKVLKCTTRGEGCLIGEQYIVSWAIGHLVTLCDPEDYGETLKKWSKETLPIIPETIKLKAIKQTLPQLKILKKLMNDKDTASIICATDSGREGELIFRYIYDISKCKKPFQRLWISSMTDTAIIEGFKNLKDSKEYDNLYLSAKCRSEADWLVGINATRAYTLKYDTLLSIGRVQTPTLAIIVSKQKEIDAFESKEYFEVQDNYGLFTGIWFHEEDNSTKIFEKEKADNIAKKIEDKDGVVLKIEKEEKRQPPPLLYDLTELQRDCNRKLGYSAQKTLTIAQSLYETKKLITYPRTDSRYLSDDMIPKIKNTLKKITYVGNYQYYAQNVLDMEKLPISKRIIDNSKVTDHHAIIPTDNNIKSENLNPEEKKVYHLIVMRFISVFYPNYIYSVTKVITEVLGEKFLSKGTVVIQEGWMEIYLKLDTDKEKESKNDKKDDQVLPELKEGELVHVNEVNVNKKKTQPPKPYNEASLLSAMENAGRFIEDENLREQLKESGLGTPATRASIIERLISVGYIVRKGKMLIPTEKGMKLVEIVPDELKSSITTGKWEKGLSSIAKGGMEDTRFMGSIKRYVNFLIGASDNSSKNIVFEEEKKKFKKIRVLGSCPLCKEGEILENTKAYYCNRWKRGCKFSIWKNSLDSYGNCVDDKKIAKLLKDGEMKGVEVTMPQTQEKCKATLILKSDLSGALELKDMTRINEIVDK